jgi:mono/diheme cytochrome c family protein
MRLKFGAVTGVAIAALAIPMLVAAQTGNLALPLTSTPNKPWPAFGANEPEQPPVLSPMQALDSFTMPPGYHLELVASEPLVQDPILMEFDPDGRLWVIEMPGWAYNEKMENSLEPVNRLVILEDTNGDRVYDKRTVFMDKLILPRAFKILDGNCALVGEPPNLWKACDTNGDLVSDSKELVDKTFGTLGILEHGANGLYWGMDNTIYVSEHNWNLRLKNGKYEILPSLRRGQWGVTQDDGGRIYRNVNTDPLFVDYVQSRYFARNPNVVSTKGLYESLVKQEETQIWPAHPTFGLNRGYRSEVYRDNGSATYYGGVSSPLIYRGTSLPREVYGQPFVADGPTNMVHLLNMTDDGNGKLSARDFYKQGEFLASTDVRFRPTALSGGWDGTIFIVDMYRGVSQDGPLQTDYLKDYIVKRNLAKDTGFGRIYRVVHDGMTTDARPQMSRQTPAQLVAHLSHRNGWWRDTAQQLLVQRNDQFVVPALKKLAARAPDPRTRLHALWTLDGMDAIDLKLVIRALDDASADVRASALRMAERWLGQPRSPVTKAVLKRMDDSNWFVRRQLAATLGELPPAQRFEPLLALLRRHGDDAITVDAAVSSLSGQEGAALAALARDAQPKNGALVMLAGATGKRREAGASETLIAFATDAGLTESARMAILDGLALGLQGGAGGGGNVVAGGRAGGGIPGVARQDAAGNRYAIPAEPVALTSLSGGKDNISAAARKVLGLITWPGRPAPLALPPRSVEEERLFAMGKTLYADNCSGCHQPQGEGSPGIAVPLAGSKRVVATGDVPVRILTNGYEGKMALMPPLGAAMSDEEIAGLLTYVRQSWGNKGTPITPAGVKEWRLAFSHRTTPWTEAEIDIRQR